MRRRSAAVKALGGGPAAAGCRLGAAAVARDQLVGGLPDPVVSVRRSASTAPGVQSFPE